MPDFERLDASVRWWRVSDKLERAEQCGYKYISEALYYLYYVEGKSLTEVGKIIDLDPRTISHHFNTWDWKRRGPGGPNFKGRKK